MPTSIGKLVFGSDAYSSWEAIRDWMVANVQQTDSIQQFLAYEKCYKITGGFQNCVALLLGDQRAAERISRARSRSRASTSRRARVILIRTGTAQYWGESGSDHAKIGEHDSAGIGIQARSGWSRRRVP